MRIPMSTRSPTEPQYDTIIVGAGPAGMTLATYLPGRILVLEQNADVGGCHYVDRGTDGLFSEHGPRVYSGAYINTKAVLKTIGVHWDDVFVKHAWSPDVIDSKSWYSHMTLRESALLSVAFATYIARPDRFKAVSVDAWATSKNFSSSARAYMNQVCLFSDGAGSDRYSMFEFMSGFNEHMLYPFYEPKHAHDKVLWPRWKAYLTHKGVEIKTNTCVRALDASGTVITIDTGERLTAPRIIFAIPPKPLASILKKSKLVEPGFEAFATQTKYNEYWSVACHFDRKPSLGRGVQSTPWGLMYVNMPFGSASESYFVVSVAATRFDVPSPTTHKTLKETTNDAEATNEIVRQLMEVIDGPPPVHTSTPNPKFGDHDAFVAAAGTGFFGPRLTCCQFPVYTVGTHNGESNYHFTSFESAVQNALVFAGVRRQPSAWKVTDVAFLVVAMIVILVAWHHTRHTHKSRAASRRHIKYMSRK